MVKMRFDVNKQSLSRVSLNSSVVTAIKLTLW